MNFVVEAANRLRELDEIYQIALLAIIVVLLFIVTLWRMPWERRAHVAQTIEALVVILALIFAGLEYYQHYQGDKDRKRQSVVDILRATMGSTVFGPAYAGLYDRSMDEVLNMSPMEFDAKIAPLSDIFWTVGACVTAGQCDDVVTRSIFCFDFKTYEFAYNFVHPEGQRWQTFDDEKLDVFCGCPRKHRFSEHKIERAPAAWPRCSRSRHKASTG